MSTRYTAFTLALFATLCACAVQPPPKPADMQVEALPGVQVPARWTADGAGPEAVAGRWLATFADPRLDALVAEAIAHNPDLKVAEAQVKVAAEYAQLADSTLWPQVNLLARGGGQMGGDSSGLQGVGLFADWELDLWGRVRSASAASKAGYESAVADAEYARQSIAALVAKSYFLATESNLQLQLAGEMVKASQDLVSLVERRQQVGKGDGYDAALARANTETFRDAEERLKLAREQALRGLEALLGRYPAAEVAAATELAKVAGPVPAGLPSELLERRPDVVAAERRVASAFYGIQEAKAARLPTIKLTGSVNDISSDLFVLKSRDNPVWSAGASLLQPVFNAGALQTQVRIRTEQQKLAIAEYGRIGARAFGEVEGALSSEFAAARRESVLARAVAENEQALELANVRYKVGSSDLRGVRQQQIAVYGSQSALIRVQTEKLVQRINLFLALGGGFDAAPAAAPVAQTKE
jgi:NodT family efflux transporter outer membrane factor (OMF) lipoprotein